jgi:hypothetical protein
VQAIKYIHKYVYKGRDKAILEIADTDEIKRYVTCRYIGPFQTVYSWLPPDSPNCMIRHRSWAIPIRNFGLQIFLSYKYGEFRKLLKILFLYFYLISA